MLLWVRRTIDLILLVVESRMNVTRSPSLWMVSYVVIPQLFSIYNFRVGKCFSLTVSKASHYNRKWVTFSLLSPQDKQVPETMFLLNFARSDCKVYVLVMIFFTSRGLFGTSFHIWWGLPKEFCMISRYSSVDFDCFSSLHLFYQYVCFALRTVYFHFLFGGVSESSLCAEGSWYLASTVFSLLMNEFDLGSDIASCRSMILYSVLWQFCIAPMKKVSNGLSSTAYIGSIPSME